MPNNKPPPNDKQPSQPKASFAFHWQDWIAYLEDVEATDEQKRELIETLWSIILVFVDLGWDMKYEVDKSDDTYQLSKALKDAVIKLEDHQQKEEV